MHITLFAPEEHPREVEASALPALLKKPQHTIWIDITSPQEDDVHLMEQVFKFHPLAIEDTRNQQQRPKIEEYDDYLFIILNPVSIVRPPVDQPAPRRMDGYDIAFRELDIFVGKNYVVTVHHDAEAVIDEARRRCGRSHLKTSAGYLLYILMDTAVDSYFPVLDAIGEEIDELEDDILIHPSEFMLSRLFNLKRRLNEVWRVTGQQRDMFNIITRRDMMYIDYDLLQYHLRDVYDHLLRITDTANTFRDLLTSMVDLYMSAVSNRLGRVVHRLTVITVAIGIMTVVSGFYGMNFERTWPPFNAEWGVPLVLALVLGFIAALLLIFRRLKWF